MYKQQALVQKLRHDKEVAYQRTLNKITINKEKAQLRRAENRQTAKQLLQNEVNTGINASCSTAGMSSSLTKALHSSAKRQQGTVNSDSDVNATTGLSESGQGYKTCTCTMHHEAASSCME
jgi:hypothetical protein